MDSIQIEISTHRQALFRFAMRMTNNRDDADDLTQETMLRAIEHVEKYDPGLPLATWLFAIMKNMYIDNVRRAKGIYFVEPDKYIGFVPNNGERLLAVREIQTIFQTLPDNERLALEAKADGMTLDEISQITNQSKKDCAGLIRTGRQRLKKINTKIYGE